MPLSSLPFLLCDASQWPNPATARKQGSLGSPSAAQSRKEREGWAAGLGVGRDVQLTPLGHLRNLYMNMKHSIYSLKRAKWKCVRIFFLGGGG